jgi:tetratricopeptide (TPR) repeat protein
MQFVLALGASVAFTGAAEAKAPSIWVQCDGYPKPAASGVKLLRGLAAVGTLGLSGLPETFNPEGRETGEAGVTACQSALAELGGSDNWLRRVTLQQGLAIHELEAKKPAEALAAVDAAVAAAGENSANLYFKRSTGVSLDILRGIALLQLGRSDEGLASVRRAAEARPWSARVKIVALSMLGIDPIVEPIEFTLAEELSRLDPSSVAVPANIYLRGGRYADAWRLYKAHRTAGAEGSDADQPGDQPFKIPVIKVKSDFSDDLLAAFAAARAGDRKAADQILEQAISEAKESGTNLAKFRSETSPEQIETHQRSFLGNIERWRGMVDAAGLLAAGDAAGAQAKLMDGKEWPASPLLADLAADIRAKLPAGERKGLVAIDPAELRAKMGDNRKERLTRLVGLDLFDILPQPETESRLNGFSKQIGFGLKGTGFKSKMLPNGLTRIEFSGTVSSPLAVEEMTMLRAAQLAADAGHKGFKVEKRSDFSRYQQMTRYGIPEGPKTLVGFMTRIEVRFADDLSDPAVVNASALSAALSPIYIRPKSAR